MVQSVSEFVHWRRLVTGRKQGDTHTPESKSGQQRAPEAGKQISVVGKRGKKREREREAIN